ncbi:hypothetical protein [Pusillimonas noertemannii]|uniref:Type IVB pilus formation R64 PilN family outer membrane protein n=1 Tax=Pusillimonas noertemannii TaxID=305977 RepID=A0A2U1CKF7_9BURK|nr:hypothetical protein [Pusillimonas noertemannii]NYT69601.1 hypothetical protein [Pusillimonas noertemannii]PVY61475.1 type IVB pilus formation R64 PilN family outer membrane protein [Pusillimonas noertemannii]TFL08931.1 hypothetical protein CSC72_14100 [Pusillimonas noertemannii]
MRGLRLLCAICATALLHGCALEQKLREIALSAEATHAQVSGQRSVFADMVGNAELRRAAQHVDRPWLAGRAQPLAREVTLPPALRADVRTTLVFPGAALDLPAIAQRITLATGIPVHVRPDALLPQERFTPRLAGTAGNAAPGVGAAATMHLAGEPGPLSSLLDRIGAALGVQWRYADRRIEFYRTETRMFNVRALTLNADAEAALGSGTEATGHGFSSASKTRLTGGKASLMEVVRQRIEPFLSQAGVVVAEPGASSTVVVTDTPDVLQRIAQYLDHENRSLTRRVRLIVDEITLATHESAEAGLDWNLIFSSARVAAAAFMPGTGLEQAGGLGLGLKQGPFSGSEVIVQALGQAGKIVRRSSLPVLTLNRRPVSHAVRTTFSYIDQVQTTALPDGAGAALPTVSVSQREETVGSLLTLVPDAQEDGQILLSVAYDNTVAQPLKSVTFGDKAHPLQLQQIAIDGNGTVQQVALWPGQPLVISGFERRQEESEARRLNPGFPMLLGGSDRASSQHLTTIMVVTAQLEEGY